MQKVKRIAICLLALIVIEIIIQQIITYTVPSKIKPFPELSGGYIVENPYQDHPISDEDIEELIVYLQDNKFRRTLSNPNSFLGNETIMIDIQTKGGPSIYVYYALYHPPYSNVQVSSKHYQLDENDRTFLHELIFDDNEE